MRRSINTDETQTLASSMPDPKKYYLIRSVQTQKVLTAENSALIQSDWVSDSNQKWFFEPLDGIDAGYYRIHSAFTGNCLDVYDSQLNNDAIITPYSCHSGENQKWRLILSSTGTYYFQAKHSNKVMDVPNNQKDVGIQIIQYSYHGYENQQWILTEVEP